MPKIPTRDEMQRFLFGLPDPVEVKSSPIEELEKFREAFAKYGGLLRQTDAASLLGIRPTVMRNYIDRGTAEAVEVFGERWVTGREVERRILHPRGPGRPSRKVRF